MNRPRILVIDDDPLFRSLLTSLLRDEFLVVSASDGSEGYYKALENPPQLAIIDLKMPVWDGLKTLRAFRGNHLLARVPLVVLTSDETGQLTSESLAAGASDYLLKTTITRGELIDKVRRQLERTASETGRESALREVSSG
jgi:PleD family two-component response regulator